MWMETLIMFSCSDKTVGSVCILPETTNTKLKRYCFFGRIQQVLEQTVLFLAPLAVSSQ